jgi:YhcH/YjgK/YiaL family protein
MSSSAWNGELPFKPDTGIDAREFVRQNVVNRPAWEAAFDFLQKNDLAALPPGRYDLPAEGVYATVSDYPAKERDSCRYEAHRKYIDIQYVAGGAEYIELLPLRLISEEQRYDEEKDILFFEDKTQGEMLYADKNRFFVFFPEDAHKPCLKADWGGTVRKIVVKIPVKD